MNNSSSGTNGNIKLIIKKKNQEGKYKITLKKDKNKEEENGSKDSSEKTPKKEIKVKFRGNIEKANQMKNFLEELNTNSFNGVCEKIEKIEIDNVALIEDFSEIIFQHATQDEQHASIYAKMCKRFQKTLKGIEYTEEEEGGRVVEKEMTIKKKVVEICNKEFEKAIVDLQKNGQKRNSNFKNENNDDIINLNANSQNNNSNTNTSDPIRNRVDSICCIIRFIAELFREEVVGRLILHSCLKKILQTSENLPAEGAEMICRLMFMVGHLLDTGNFKSWIDEYFNHLKSLASKNIPDAICRMIDDLTNLRNQHWNSPSNQYNKSTMAKKNKNANNHSNHHNNNRTYSKNDHNKNNNYKNQRYNNHPNNNQKHSNHDNQPNNYNQYNNNQQNYNRNANNNQQNNFSLPNYNNNRPYNNPNSPTFTFSQPIQPVELPKREKKLLFKVVDGRVITKSEEENQQQN